MACFDESDCGSHNRQVAIIKEPNSRATQWQLQNHEGNPATLGCPT